MKPAHTKYASAETLVFPDAITLKILLKGSQTNGSHTIIEDIVESGVGPSRHIHLQQDNVLTPSLISTKSINTIFNFKKLIVTHLLRFLILSLRDCKE
jgi:hypothetical protein